MLPAGQFIRNHLQSLRNSLRFSRATQFRATGAGLGCLVYWAVLASPTMSETILLVDAYSVIYRAFYAIRSLTGPQGQPVNAVYGFTKMLRKLLSAHRPTHCAVVFDLGAPRKRLAVLPSYKEQRPPTPPDLDVQLPIIRNILAALRVPVVEVDGEEADDIIATLTYQAAKDGVRVLIASTDKDFIQLIGPRVELLRPNSENETVYDAAAVRARYGVRPDQIVDFLSLVGDSVDNIPGVPGVGEKTAADLLQRYDNIENLLARASELPRHKLRDALLAAADRIRRNRDLIRLSTDLSLPAALSDLKVQTPNYGELTGHLKLLGFKSLVAELDKEAGQSGDLFLRL
jgi:DNA polymerase I